MPGTKVDKFVARLSELDRSEVIKALRAMKCDFPIDFTDESLASMSVERLRHVATGVSLHARNLDKLSV